MRYRKLDANGDYVFGHGQSDFYRDQPEAVAQAVQTRLELFSGEWFLDTSAGLPWRTQVLGKYTQNIRDFVIKQQIVNTQGVQSLDSYSSSVDPNTRRFSVSASITTIYGPATVETTL
ncbi:hypothetical protein [Dyella japonica]|uniref:Bacteriophage protein n=1 Tax=Dyella japonica TaxID=231455 RepID=A0ABV2JZ55_9GAMM